MSEQGFKSLSFIVLISSLFCFVFLFQAIMPTEQKALPLATSILKFLLVRNI